MNVEEIASTFVEARHSNRVLPTYPGEAPATLVDAYRIQDRAIAIDGRVIGGWKIGRIAPKDVEHFGSDRIVGPIFRDSIRHAGTSLNAMPILSAFAAAEVEVVMRFNGDADRAETLEEWQAAVAEVRIGLEIASSPFAGINDHGPAITASDFGNNFGLLIGPEIEDWSNVDPASIVDLRIGGLKVGSTPLGSLRDDPLRAVRELSRALRSRSRRIDEGQWISTGALTGVHRVTVGQLVEAEVNGQPVLNCSTTLAS